MIEKRKPQNEPELEYIIQRWSEPTGEVAKKLDEFYVKIGKINDFKLLNEKIDLYTQIIEEFKEYPLVLSKAYGGRAQIKKQLDGKDDWKYDMIKSLILDPKQINSTFLKGKLFLELGMPDKAIPEFQKQEEITSRQYESALELNNQALNYLAAAYMDAGKYREAADALEKAISRQTSYQSLYFASARINLALSYTMIAFTYTGVFQSNTKNYLEKARDTLKPVIFQKSGINSEFPSPREEEFGVQFTNLIQIADAKVIYALLRNMLI